MSDMLGLSIAQGQVTREEVEEVNKMVTKVVDLLSNQLSPFTSVTSRHLSAK